jgi:hypothetical protein
LGQHPQNDINAVMEWNRQDVFEENHSE